MEIDEGKPYCAWNSFAYFTAIPALQSETYRAMYSSLHAAGFHFEPPCAHLSTLPSGVAFAAIHIRCGDIATRPVRHHYMVKPAWLKSITPLITSGIGHVVL